MRVLASSPSRMWASAARSPSVMASRSLRRSASGSAGALKDRRGAPSSANYSSMLVAAVLVQDRDHQRPGEMLMPLVTPCGRLLRRERSEVKGRNRAGARVAPAPHRWTSSRQHRQRSQIGVGLREPALLSQGL